MDSFARQLSKVMAVISSHFVGLNFLIVGRFTSSKIWAAYKFINHLETLTEDIAESPVCKTMGQQGLGTTGELRQMDVALQGRCECETTRRSCWNENERPAATPRNRQDTELVSASPDSFLIILVIADIILAVLVVIGVDHCHPGLPRHCSADVTGATACQSLWHLGAEYLGTTADVQLF